MVYEIDYIPVGDGDRSGDAIALRFGNFNINPSEQTVVVIDGGFKESGKSLVEHIRKYYNTNQVDLVISTHPDLDHASGLTEVLENLRVGTLAIHLPWEHANDIKNLFKDGRITASGLEDRLEKGLQSAKDLEELAIKKGIKIVEPFEGLTGFDSQLHILGPSTTFYESLLPLFRSTPGSTAPTRIFTKIAESVKWLLDRLDIDLLDDDEDTTSAENNSSTIALFQFGDDKMLFTGDAGKTGILNAINYANGQSISLANLNLFDVPHHGSKRNISSKILNSIKAINAFISASGNSPKHPSKKVTNALKKHNTKVYVNRNKTICHSSSGLHRDGWGPVAEEPFYSQVEE